MLELVLVEPELGAFAVVVGAPAIVVAVGRVVTLGTVVTLGKVV